MSEIKIAILDPVIKARHELAELLSRYGIKVIEYGTSSKLFDGIGQDCDIDLVIMETELYKENPFNVMIKIRKYVQVPIIVYSSNISRKNYISSFIYGACDYIVKPYDQEGFITRILSYIKNYKNLKPDEYNVNMNIQEYMKYSYKMALRGGYPLNILVSNLFVKIEKYSKEFDDEYYKLIPILREEIMSKLSDTDFSFAYGSQSIVTFAPFYDEDAIKNVIQHIDNINVPTISINGLKGSEGLKPRVITEYICYPDEERDWNKSLVTLPRKINERLKGESSIE